MILPQNYPSNQMKYRHLEVKIFNKIYTQIVVSITLLLPRIIEDGSDPEYHTWTGHHIEDHANFQLHDYIFTILFLNIYFCP